MAYWASSMRPDTPSFPVIWWRWFLTVCSLTNSDFAICSFVNPCATSSITSRWQVVSETSEEFEPPKLFMIAAVIPPSSQISPL